MDKKRLNSYMCRVLRVMTILKSKKAVSPILATIIIFAMIIVGVAVGFVQIMPYIDRAQAENSLASTQISFTGINNAILELIQSGSVNVDQAYTPTAKVNINKPTGFIKSGLTDQYFGLRIGNSSYSLVQEFLPIPVGSIYYEIESSHDFIPKNSRKYQIGPQPFLKREPIVLVSPDRVSAYEELTNLSLTNYQAENIHRMYLNYRPKVVIEISFTPRPIIKIDLFIINVTCGFESLPDAKYQMTVTASIGTFSKEILAIPTDFTELQVLYGTTPYPQSVDTELWSSNGISGFSPSSFELQFTKIFFQVSLT